MTDAPKKKKPPRAKQGGQSRSVSLADRLLEIGRDCARRLGPEYRLIDHDSLLYDENGLPRTRGKEE